MNRRQFLMTASGVLVPTTVLAAGRGRISRQGTAAPVVSNPDPPPVSFFENLNARTLASDGYCQWALNYVNVGPTAGSNRVYVAYMDNAGGCNTGAHNIKVACVWDYTTGTSDAFTTIDTINPSSSDSHEVPSIHRLVNGKLMVIYGGVTAADSGGNSPFYRLSTAADNVTAFGSAQRITSSVFMSENTGGTLSNDELHLIGAGANQNVNYVSYVPGTATWTTTTGFIADGGGTPGSPPVANGFQGDPVGGFRTYVVPGTTTLYHIWGRDVSAGSGSSNGIYLIKSTDGGTTWTDIAGANSFTRTGKLTGTFNSSENLYDYGTTRKVHAGVTSNGLGLAVLANGRPVITFRDSGGLKCKLYSGSGSGTGAWSTVTIDAGSTDTSGNQSCNLIVTSGDKLITYASPSANGVGNVKEYTSTDGGSTWSSSTIWTKSSETANKNWHPRIFTGLGGKERVLLCWIQTFDGTRSSLMFMDRPQS